MILYPIGWLYPKGERLLPQSPDQQKERRGDKKSGENIDLKEWQVANSVQGKRAPENRSLGKTLRLHPPISTRPTPA